MKYRSGMLCTIIGLLVLPIASVAEWDVGLESVNPTGDFGDAAGGGGGGDVQRLQPLNDSVLLSGYVGAISYGGISGFGIEIQWYGYPLTVGGVYYPQGTEEGGPFVKANAGLLYKMGTVTYAGREEDSTDTGYVLSPGVGWDFGRVNVAAEYNLGNDEWTWFAIKAAYRFGT